MGMDGMKSNFHTRIFIMVLAICWVLVGGFMIFQYDRERQFKTSLLDTQLQMYNSRIIEELRSGESVEQIVSRIDAPIEELRFTLIDRTGKVIYDNNDRTPFPSSDHSTRPEVVMARQYGKGHATARHSESDDINYFYSAQLGDNGIVVRSAAPYNHSLDDFLAADRTLIWIMGGLTLLMSLIAYWATRKISTSIERLNRFAEKAERGEKIYDDEAFPDDELGSIASHIVRLYAQRDERHREALRQERDKIRLKKQLTNNINHELKTPVASILVSLDLLRDHPEMDEVRKKEFIERIYVNARRLESLLKDVSAITRMDEGAEMITKEEINLTELVREIVDEERARTSMRIILDMQEITVKGNKPLLDSVFRNLIDNAIAYSGGEKIEVKGDREGNFEVSDDGCGIPPEHLPHIFERFYRIDAGRSREAGGTGLGLSIVKNAINLHGGDIRVVSNNGVTFYFNLK